MEIEEMTKEELCKEINIRDNNHLLQGIAYMLMSVLSVVLCTYSLVFAFVAAFCSFQGVQPLYLYWKSRKYTKLLNHTLKMLHGLDDDTWEKHHTEIEQILQYSVKRMDNGMEPKESLERINLDIAAILNREQKDE